MNENEVDDMLSCLNDEPRCDGLSAISARAFLRKEFPSVPHWMCWLMEDEREERQLRAFVGAGIRHEGTFGPWRWQRVPCTYPEVHFWDGDIKRTSIGNAWTGVLKVSSRNGEEFYIFSYLRSDRRTNAEYLVSTGDMRLLRRFASDLRRHFGWRRKAHTAVIDMHGGPNVELDVREDEPIHLSRGLKRDIETQVFSFFQNEAFYKSLKIPHTRGFLFSGAPGTGKTLMIRRLVRECHKRFKVRVSCLAIKGSTDADDLARFFSSGMYGSDEKRILVLEDLDSLTRETRIPRAFLLNQLDGLHQKKGILVLGTTNHPEALDPALVHRPSRFDRVWHFPLPSLAIRLQWFRETYGHVDAEQLERLARQTGGWSFAYLKELRITAGIEALHAGADAVNGENLMSAHQLLAAQFKAGKKGGAVGDDEASDIAGFRGGSKEMSLSALLAAAPQATERAQHPGQDEGSARFSAHAA